MGETVTNYKCGDRIVIVTTDIMDVPAVVGFADIFESCKLEDGSADCVFEGFSAGVYVGDMIEDEAKLSVAMEIIETLEEFGVEVKGVPGR